MVSRAKLFGIALCFLFVSQSGFAQQYNYEKRQGIAQDAAGEELDDGDFNFGESMLTLFFPRGVKDTWRLKRYIRSERFSSVRGRAGDLRAVDAILRRALEISHGDVSEALFICTFASMEHRMVGIRLPLIRLPVYFPLKNVKATVYLEFVSLSSPHIFMLTVHAKSTAIETSFSIFSGPLSLLIAFIHGPWRILLAISLNGVRRN